jgi:hypothetical protein
VRVRVQQLRLAPQAAGANASSSRQVSCTRCSIREATCTF